MVSLLALAVPAAAVTVIGRSWLVFSSAVTGVSGKSTSSKTAMPLASVAVRGVGSDRQRHRGPVLAGGTDGYRDLGLHPRWW